MKAVLWGSITFVLSTMCIILCTYLIKDNDAGGNK